jgi:archaellum component FlaC
MKYNFKALFEYLKEEFSKIDQRFEDTKQNFSNLQSSVDGIAKQTEDHRKELVVINHRTARIEKWVKKAADKIHIPYET